MSEQERIRIYTEGKDDRAIVHELCAAGLVTGNFELAEVRDPAGGKDEMMRYVADLVGYGGDAIAMRDLDDLTADKLADWAKTSLESELRAKRKKISVTKKGSGDERISILEVTGEKFRGQVVPVPVGLPNEQGLLDVYRIKRYAIDDYLLRMVGDQQIYDALSEFKDVKHAKAMDKLTKVVDMLRKNKIRIEHSKRLLHVLRGITGFRASPATFASRLIQKALAVRGRDRVRELFSPLLDDLEKSA